MPCVQNGAAHLTQEEEVGLVSDQGEHDKVSIQSVQAVTLQFCECVYAQVCVCVCACV
jgi:hypothetical protein